MKTFQKGATQKEFAPREANSFLLELTPIRWKTKLAVASRESVLIYFTATCKFNPGRTAYLFLTEKICQSEEFKLM